MRKLLTPLSLALGFLGVTLLGFVVSAHAANAVAPDSTSVSETGRAIFDQIMAGHYVAAAAFTLVFVVALAKRYAPGKMGEFVHSDHGGALTTLLMAFGGALATATVGGAPWTWAMCWAALGVGVTAAGGYTMLKKLVVEPLLRPLMAKAPAWAQPIFAMVLWMFDKPMAADQKATVAGEQAVNANPGGGADAVTGAAKDL